jgi:hypothetical protein
VPAGDKCQEDLEMTNPNNISQEIQDFIRRSEHIVLIGLLIEHAKAHDPEFSREARERLDYVLGKYFIGEDPAQLSSLRRFEPGF